ncbi:NAD(P)/FAD-dependent oxidoreductase [Ramlibacter ginsenosidimutans]|uniref:NAD(P)/FAD-dependent oxidoreductase n=1 Tax=Ramlibacter ginsenosidimutans TaxID=502333 RepID=A0A934WLC2_9BURK|nr:NAD(P)/FAD-dependent oxidoreductase [Ramlibacter ginsenosidimutans]MBK6005421.1 NAD(P)/FAD-dependent oxidoreductase [Ramlibacter ginsenosidimutans]
MDAESLDVVIVGAGLSGISAAHYLRSLCPGRSFVLLEGRDALGGTWDLFRYPGVRSDSDMFTLGYTFRPWTSDAAIADGASIREYIRDTARAEGVLGQIRFRHRVTGADWNAASARWTVHVDAAGTPRTLHCRFLFFCSGYYDYARGHEPEFPGREAFAGRIVHPQQWPEDLDVTGKRVVVIGSGATAITLIPSLARQAAHVTMLQRSPSYILALPGRDKLGRGLQRWLPRKLAYRLIRWKNILLSTALFQFARRRPEKLGRWLVEQAHRSSGVDRKHLQPNYDPWDQRLCIAPDADFFAALREGRASVATDRIERFTATGVRLASGEELPADIVVTATGLKLQLFGGARLTVDGRPVQVADALSYKGMMLAGVPNFALAMGYTNASWTLKAELIARQVCRVLNYMRDHDLDVCMPVQEGDAGATRPALDLQSGYIARAAGELPRQGSRKPWRIHQNYVRDLIALKFSPLRDGALRFGRAGEAVR